MFDDIKDLYKFAFQERILTMVDFSSNSEGLVKEGKNPMYRKIGTKLFPSLCTEESLESSKKMTLRNDDIFVVSFPKSGNTWCRHIILQLINEDYFNGLVDQFYESPIIECFGGDVIELLPSPRVLKTHFDYEDIPKGDGVKYVFTIRNPKDVIVSYYHHHKNFDHYQFSEGDFNLFFDLFINGKTEYGCYFEYLKGWLPHIKNSNVLFIKYEDMSKDLEGYIKIIGNFIGGKAIDTLNDEKKIKQIVENSKIQSMQKGVPQIVIETTMNPKFFRKGCSRDWKNYFTKEQSDIVDQKFSQYFGNTEVNNWWTKELSWE
uniref:Sulfotransferase 6B1 (inferred by orthology to a human protein) n=1 Tax=Strongyloides venezuelensis TaxID=75913 RepID=A0A0K0F406_STRVS